MTSGDVSYKAILDRSSVPTLVVQYPSFEIVYRNRSARQFIDDNVRRLGLADIDVSEADLESLVKRDDSSTPKTEPHINIVRDCQIEVLSRDADQKPAQVLIQLKSQETSASFGQLYDDLPIMVTQHTRGHVLHNEEFFAFTGRRALLPNTDINSFLELIHPEERAPFVEAVMSDTTMKSNSEVRPPQARPRVDYLHRLKTAKSGYRWVKTSAVYQGEVHTFLTSDVHDFYVRAAELRDKDLLLKLQKQENQRLVDTESMANEGNRLKGEFLANTSHEIRTPIAGVIGMVELLLDTELDEEQRDYANSIRSSADALLTVINDVLDFSKIEAGKMQIVSKPFELSQMVKDLETMLSFMSSKKGLTLHVDLEPGPVFIKGDSGRVRQILTNLLSNAIKFTPNGSVSLQVIREEEKEGSVRIRFVVTDTGTGMSQQTMKNLFRPFAQGEAGRTYGGTGLGLSICKKLIELMDGDVGVETTLGKGSKFWFSLSFEHADGSDSRTGSLSASQNSCRSGSGQASDRSAMLTREALASYSQRENSTGKSSMSNFLSTEDHADVGSEPEVESGSEPESKTPDSSTDYPLPILRNRSFQNPKRPKMPLDRGISTDSLNTLRGNTQCLSDGEDVLDEEEVGTDVQTQEDDSVLSRVFTDTSASERGSVVSRASSMDLGSASPSKSAISMSYTADRSTSTSTQGYKDKNILLAEDNEINCKIATAMLRKLGYSCSVVKNGQQAVDAIDEQCSFDLILMDVQMPVLNGYEATALIRKSTNEAMRTIPVIALTASAVSGDREKCIAAGMDDYLTKPVNARQLEKKLKKWLDL